MPHTLHIGAIGLCVLLFGSSLALKDWDENWDKCPGLLPTVFTSYTPRGNLTHAAFTKQPSFSGIKQCVMACCNIPLCNVALMYNTTCFHVRCLSSNMCAPLFRPDLNGPDPPRMVLVKPIKDDEMWADLLETLSDDPGSSSIDTERESTPLFRSARVSCDGPSGDCPQNEVCLRCHETDSEPCNVGFCECIIGYRRSITGICNPVGPYDDDDLAKVSIDTTTSIKPPMKQLVVSAVSKEVRLPENEVSLSAFTVPAEQGNEHYNYAWSLLSQPDGHTGTMADQNRMTVKLSNLSEGLYKFRVAVSSPYAYGEAYANVSVLPRE